MKYVDFLSLGVILLVPLLIWQWVERATQPTKAAEQARKAPECELAVTMEGETRIHSVNLSLEEAELRQKIKEILDPIWQASELKVGVLPGTFTTVIRTKVGVIEPLDQEKQLSAVLTSQLGPTYFRVSLGEPKDKYRFCLQRKAEESRPWQDFVQCPENSESTRETVVWWLVKDLRSQAAAHAGFPDSGQLSKALHEGLNKKD